MTFARLSFIMLPSKQLNESSKNEANMKVLNIFGNKVKHN